MSKKQRKNSAISLKYERGIDNAPRVTAKGKGAIADKIIALAEEQSIPIKKDKDLMELLEKIDIGQDIPEALYKVVAELLAWVYSLNIEYPKKDRAS